MASDDSLPTLKLLLIGPSGAGKSALLTRYCEDVFEPESATATIGIDFKIKKLSVRGKAYRVTLFDTVRLLLPVPISISHPLGPSTPRSIFPHPLTPKTPKAGQERFRTLSTSYYRGAHGVLLVYDVSSRASFAAMETWFAEAEVNTSPGVVLYLVGAKTDKPNRAVSTEEGAALAAAHGAHAFAEASARTGEGVRRPFVELVDAVVERGGAAGEARAAGLRVGREEGEAAGAGGGCSC
ncbi:unnamed protein product [Discula destructiva]